MALKETAQMYSDRGDYYTIVNGRQYQILQFRDWQLPAHGGPVCCAYSVRPVSSTGCEERLIGFFIGCEVLFGGEVYVSREDQIPKELATLTIQWLLEEAGEPPVGYEYRGVFTREGLRHRVGQPEDRQFGESVCPTLRDVVEQVRRNLLEAKKRGRQIGLRPSGSEFWTQEAEKAQRA